MEVLERGDITFFFRPTVQSPDELEATLGVQSFFMVMGRDGGCHRRVRVGKKHLPTRPGQRFWARVERTGSLERVVGDQLDDAHYSTKTRGERYQPGARPIGAGTYEFLRHGDHIHFTYRLEELEPDAPDALQLPDEGDFLLLFENSGRSRAVWSVAGDPAQLDSEGTELVICGHGDCTSRSHGKSEMVEGGEREHVVASQGRKEARLGTDEVGPDARQEGS